MTESLVDKIFHESIIVKQKALEANRKVIVQAAKVMLRALKRDRKIILCGNGGSAADSQHIAAEFIGRFQKERKALSAVALTTDTSIITALANDYSYDQIFSRQVEGLGQKGDVLVGISTSGRSINVIAAMRKAKTMGITTIALTGSNGGSMGKSADIHLNVPVKRTARVQESHICILHCLCELVEEEF